MTDTTAVSLRRTWFLGTMFLSAAPFVLSAAVAPVSTATLGPVLGWLVIFGNAGHVVCSTWLVRHPEIRGLVGARRQFFVVGPAALVVAATMFTFAAPPRLFGWMLLAYFAWEFFHFQKQNLGIVALTASAYRAGSLREPERKVVVAAGCCGVAGLLTRPELLDLSITHPFGCLFPLAGVSFAATVGFGFASLARREPSARPSAFVGAYVMALLFFAPVFAFRAPFAAVAALIIAHGLQHVWLVTMIERRPVPVAGVLATALVGGLVLNALSDMYGSPLPIVRALWGLHLGLVMMHFVFDSGVWKLRREGPRHFVAARMPFLVPAPATVR